MKRISATVNLKAIKNNMHQFTKHLPKEVKKIAVIKADAYGHGAVEVAKYLNANAEIFDFAVATFEEAVELRENGIDGSILVLGCIDSENAKDAEKLDITISVGTVEYAKEVFSNGSPKSHLQIDTGMSRMGIYCHSESDIKNAVCQIKMIKKIAKENLIGIYTHFVQSEDTSSPMTSIQYNVFTNLISECEKENISFQIKHCCNSCGSLNFGNFALDAVRIGIGLYGYGADVDGLIPAMTFKTKIIKIFEGKKGDTVSYNGTYTLEEDKKIAVCGAGYADGVSRQLSNKGYYIVKGKKADILGRVCMDLSMIDITGINCSVGDEAIIFGETLSAEEVAKTCNTISYEILCAVSKRVPREYTE